MQPRLLLAVSALLMGATLAVPAAPAQADATVVFDFAGSGAVNVDAITEGSKTIRFQYTESTSSAWYPARAMYATLSNAAQTIDVSLGPQGGQWVGTMPVANVDLVLGTWEARLFAIDDHGVQHQAAPTSGSPRTLVVGGADTAAPKVTFAGLNGTSVVVGPADAVRILVTDQLLRSVSYRVPGLPREFKLNEPYELDASNFLEGKNNLTVRALDRAGKQTLTNVTVIVDSKAPVVSYQRSDTAPVGVPYTLVVRVQETTAYDVRLELANKTTVQTGTATTGRDHTFNFTPTQVGNLSYRIVVRDTLGNVVANTTSVAVVRPILDVAVAGLLPQNAPVIVGTPAQMRLEVRQTGNALSARQVPLNVTLDGVELPAGVVDVAAAGTGSKLLTFNLVAGQHEVRVELRPVNGTQDLDAANNVGTFNVEVFLGRVGEGATAYLIRAGPDHRPSHAVQGNKTYALRLVDVGLSSAYAFDVEGTTLQWVPGQLSGGLPTTSGSATDTSTGAKGSPGPLPLALLAAIAIAFAVARRR